ncbi:MAG: RecQ family ATP-dependent DNA helicase [Ignavibacteria bacterium]|nr:RecQ family ATP-dependent DNA helicase [Ignavibacteria bacterium]
MSSINLEKILFENFGYTNFRDPQKEIIKTILQGNDVLAILPTGAGKSICYQLPSLIFDGLTIVISPLISLMQDQVHQIKNKIPAAFLNSFQSYSEQQQVNTKILDGKIKLLYVSPEKFNTESFRDLVKKINVSLIAVDEAHCISQWGHDFRPSYLKISEIFNYIPRCNIAAFTATATPEVRADIIQRLNLLNPKIFIKGFFRPNIYIEVIKTKNRVEKIYDLLNEIKGSKIIYCPTRKDTEELNEKLLKRNFTSLPYHAGMSKDERKTIQEFFIGDKSEIIVATNAFGMGINKPDIRGVIHYGMPGSIESYYQEIGRSGRDGYKSFSYLLYQPSDRKIHEFFVANAYPERKTILEFYNKVNDYLKLKVGEQSQKIIPLDFKKLKSLMNDTISEQQIQSIISILEKNEIIKIVSENDYVTIKVNISPMDFNQIEENLTINESTLIEFLFRKFGTKIIRQEIRINLSTLVNETGIYYSQIEGVLHLLEQDGLIDYKLVSFDEGFYFTIPRQHSELLPINFAELDELRSKGISKINEMEKFVHTNDCRWKFILKYFGENIPDDFKCENCDNCKYNLKAIDFSSINIEKEILKTIKEVNGKFGTNTIIDILRGSKSKKIMEYNLYNVSTYGFLSGVSREKIKQKIDELILQDKIEKAASLYPTLSITSKGEDELENQKVIELKIETKKTSSLSIDLRKNIPLFDRLKNLRKQLASRFNQPEYLVCSDEMLREISIKMPRTKEEFYLIPNMTEKIFLKCGDAMLEEINSFLQEQGENEKEKHLTENVRITLNMVREGLSLVEICEKRNLSDTLIAEHITTLIENSFEIDLEKLIPKSHIDLIEKALAETDSKFLPLIKSKLPEEISYAEIRIVMSYINKLNQRNEGNNLN